MIKTILSFLFCLSCVVVSIAQPNELYFKGESSIQVLDTIIVFSKESFDIQDRLYDWSSNFNDIDYTISVFSILEHFGKSDLRFSNFIGGFQRRFGQQKDFTSAELNVKSKVERGGNPGDYLVNMDFTISPPGVFYVVGVIKGKSERGAHFENAGYWVINCVARAENRLSNDFSIKRTYDFNSTATYRYGESIAFDFSISGARMNNLSSYHYKIYEDEHEIFAGIGSYINLDFITKNPAMINHTFNVKGLYSGQLIKFFNPSIPGPDSTYWRFKLLPPEKLEIKTNWISKDKFDLLGDKDVIDAIDLRLIENRKFSFAWLTNQGDGAMITRPKLIDITVSSEPNDLLRSDSQTFTTYEEDYWQVIELNVNPAFINRIANDEIKKVTITLKFQTMFGEQKSLAFVGVVF
jgi:hypothetical protein